MAVNIFIEKSITCPSCCKISDLRYPNPRLYVASERDSDNRIRSYTWRQDIKTEENPEYYSVWQCPFCCFSDLRQNIENFRKTSKNNELIRIFRNMKGCESFNVVRLLRRHSIKGYSKIPYAAKLLTAIFIRSQVAEEKKDYESLGKLYLKLGWVFRDLTERCDFVPENHKGEVRDKRVADAVESLESCCISMADDINNLKLIAAEVLNGNRIDFMSVIDTISERLGSLRLSVELAREHSGSGYRVNGVKKGKEDIGNFKEKFNKLLVLWPGVPLSESEAMEKAAEAFDMSYKSEDSERSMEQGLALVNLILTIFIQIHNYDKALDYIDMIFKSAFRDKQDLQHRLNRGKKDKSLSDYDERMLYKKINNINLSISRAGERRKEIFENILYERRDEIDLIIKNSDQEIEEAELKLKNMGVRESMIIYLKEKGVICEKKKKGWFKH